MEDNGPAQHLLWPEAPGKRHRKGPPAVGEQHRQVSGVVRVRLLLRVEMSPGAIKGDIASGAAAAQRMDMQGKKAVPRQPGGPRDQQSTLLPGIEQDFSQQTGIGAVSTQHSAERRDALQQDLGQGRMSTVHGKRLQSYPSVCGPAPSRTNQNRTSRVRLILFPSHDYAARAALFHRTAVYIGGTRPIRTANAAPAGAVEAAGKNKTASTGETGDNTRLTETDIQAYLNTGKTGHTRNKKARLLESGKSPILTTAKAVKDFILSAIGGKSNGEVRGYGKVGTRFADAVRGVDSTVDIDGYYLELDADSLRHAYLQHSDAKQAGDISLSKQDFFNIPDYVDNFDYILAVENYRGKQKIRLAKKINGYSVILETVSGERNSLQVLNMIGMSTEKFMDKYKNQIRGAGSQGGASAQTVNTTSLHTDSTSNSAPIIADSSAKGNTQSAQNSGGQTGDDGVGAANAGFAGDYNRLQNQSERFHPEGEKAARPVDVPVEDFQGRSIPKSAATVLEAGATPDREFTQRIDSNRKGSQKEKSPEPDGSGDLCLMSCLLHSAGDLTRTEASGAHVHVLGRTVYNRLDALHVGLPGTVGAAVGVGDMDTEHNALIAKFTFGHSLIPPRFKG